MGGLDSTLPTIEFMAALPKSTFVKYEFGFNKFKEEEELEKC